MPSLQIRDVPEDIYAAYKKCCAQDDRSMSQQTLRLIKTYLAAKGCIEGSDASADGDACDHAEACRISTPTLTQDPSRISGSHWGNSVYNPMADIIGREERIAKRKALFEHIDQQDFGPLKLPPGYESIADLIREDRDTDHGHDRLWKELA